MNPSISNPEHYDLVVLGSGVGGKLIAWTSAQTGQRVVVIERRYVGGSCPNIACLPSKNIIHSAKVASLFFRSEEFGVSKENVRINMSAVRERKRKMVQNLVNIHLENYRKSGAEFVMGTGRFVAPKTIEVALNDGGTRTFRGKNVVIDTGTRATLEPIPGLLESMPLTHIEALELDHIPKHLVVLGGGYVGLELGQAFRRFGSEVTLLDRNSRLAHHEDEDISQALAEMCRDEGIRVVTNVKVTKVEGQSGDGLRLLGTHNGDNFELSGSHLLVAGGRTPNTSGIGLELAGVETRVTTGRQVPFCLFTDPEFARVGLTEAEAKQRGIHYRVAKLPMAAVFRAMTISETRGFMRILIDTEIGRILGFAMFGVGAGDVLATVQIAMLAGVPYTALRDAIIAHPTMPEGLVHLLSSVPAKSAHPPGSA